MNNESLDISQLFSAQAMSDFFIKSFGIVFSILFITYAVISYKQVQDVAKTVRSQRNGFIIFFSLLQILIGLFLLAFAIFFV